MRLDVLNTIEKAALIELEKAARGTINQATVDKLHSLGLAEIRNGIPQLTGEGRVFLMHSRYHGFVR
ncbi:hypothetical protein CPter291_3285 [Collimonas pratensis]|uniref:Uncharacterized protein n=1 Tax=Collimonas pratensis TaxID=279113 RepID=A0ABN4MBA9_9BURK|nr:hypothetical protein CPter291_3285 [Collimonas pratensis]